MPKRRKVTSSEQKIPAKDDGSVPKRPLKLRKQNRPLEDKEICENLTNESDDNCSDFDDDVGDPDFILESDHNTESEQSDEDDVDVTYPHVEEVYHGEINHNHDNEEQEREVRAHGSQDITEQIGKETIVGEKQHGAAETRIEEIGEEQYSEVETRNDQGSEDLRIDQEPNEELTGELPRYFYGKNRYKWASAEPSRTSRVRVHNIVNAPSQGDISRGRFLLLLARELVLPEMKLRVYNERIPRELRLSIERVIGPADMPEPPPPKTYQDPDSGVRETCAICPSRLKRRTKYCCCKCKKPMCLTCCLQICIDCKCT
ncbi:unnamed protein product [Parnassius apollo]|uniref:(apollo) hypothetical protein n=1 Tax=Parnassius apollo TaxID=110799 RepID=A0A8S3W6W2_PARAO|nr:unnamed protein product [Parnassius apollo]